MGGFKVMSRACDECLFSKDRIVSGARAAQIIAKTHRENCHFVCHKSHGGEEIACHDHHKTGAFDESGTSVSTCIVVIDN